MTERSLIVENIERLMAARDLNPASLAAAAGLNPTGVRDIILGKSRNPRQDTLEKLANALGIPAYALTQDPDRISLLVEIDHVTRDFTEQEMRALKAYAKMLKSEARGDDS